MVDGAAGNLAALFLTSITAAASVNDRIKVRRKIVSNAVAFGKDCSLPLPIITLLKNICIIAPAIIGPIEPPMILIVFITAAEVPITAFGMNKMTTASRVTNRADPIPKKIRLIASASGVECTNKIDKNAITRIAAAGISNFVAPNFAATIPATEPTTIITNEKGSCSRPTSKAFNPNPPTEVGFLARIGTDWNIKKQDTKSCKIGKLTLEPYVNSNDNENGILINDEKGGWFMNEDDVDGMVERAEQLFSGCCL